MILLSLVTQTGRMQQTLKKGFTQHEKSAVHRSAVIHFVEVPSSTDDIVGTVTKNLLVIHFVEVPSSTDDIVGTVTKNLLEIQQKDLSALMKILSIICYLARQRLPLRCHNDSESNFCQLLLLRAEDDSNFQEWLHKETNRFISPAI